MKIQVEILEKRGMGYAVKNTEIITIGDRATKINTAKLKLETLKLNIPINQKIRVLEYHNDEPDETRTACKILFEG